MSAVEIPSDEPWVRDTDHNILREYDDVVLLASAIPISKGNCAGMPKCIQEGTIATIIVIARDESGTVELECYVSPGKFALQTRVGHVCAC